MTLHEAIELFREHQKNSARDKTRESYSHLLKNLETLLGDHAFECIVSQDLYQFLILLTEGRAKNTARLRYAQLKGFFYLLHREDPCRAEEPVRRSPSCEDLPGSENEATGDHRPGSDRRNHLPLSLGERPAHPRTPGTLRHENRGGTASESIGCEWKKADDTASEIGPG
jgi:hypothetical protein